MVKGEVGGSVCELTLSLREVEVSAPDNNSTTLVSRFDDNVRVGPERTECSKFRERQVRMGERSREIEATNVTPTVLNEKIKRRQESRGRGPGGGRILEVGKRIR